MTVHEVLMQVRNELKNENPWKITHVEARRRILELFHENDIPETEYAPYMANNVLPELLLK